jgi:hypothetical protein
MSPGPQSLIIGTSMYGVLLEYRRVSPLHLFTLSHSRCLRPTVQTFTNLPAQGFQLIPVLASWKDPCHLEFYQMNASTGEIILPDFNSGAFNVNATKAAIPVTWAADDTNQACPTSFTGGALQPSATNTVPVQNGTASATSATTSPTGAGATGSCTAPPASTNGSTGSSSSPSFGAGIGVGIGISVGIVALSALIFILGGHFARRKARSGQPAAEMDGDPTTSSSSGPSSGMFSGFFGGSRSSSTRWGGRPKTVVAGNGVRSELVGDTRISEMPTSEK